MRIYAAPGWRMAGQVFGDVAVLVWGAGCAWAGRELARAVGRLAAPAQRTGELAGQLSGQMGQARDQVSQVPGLGQELSRPFGGLSDGLQQIMAQTQEQASAIHHLAQFTGWLVFLLPTVAALLWWIPRRVRFARLSAAAQRFIDADADLELFALRAMAHVPMHQLAKVSNDPVRQWRTGDAEVVRRLAQLELRREGIALPRPLRGSAGRPARRD